MSCLFCRMASGEIKPNTVLETPDVLAFHDINPEAPVHVLVIPKAHIANVGSAGPEDVELLGKVLVACRHVAEQTGIDQSGFRVVLNTGGDAGQSVGHLHAHVLGGRVLAWPPG